MVDTLSRRNFNKLLFSGLLGSAFGLAGFPYRTVAAASSKRVVVVGGGFGGATAARYLKMADPSIAVTLVEPKAAFSTCPLSNWVIGGLKRMDEITHGYQVLRDRYKVEVITDRAIGIDAAGQSVRLKGGKTLRYDRLVVAPGVDFIWGAISGYSEQIAESRMPHAYEAGPQTLLLQRQLHSMADGENVIISSPANQFRCPAAPYERAGLIAHYLKQHKPKSRVIILDAKDGFTKQDLFMQGWERRYPGMVEWRSASAGGAIGQVDAAAMTVSTEFGVEKGGVINVIPSQRAGRIAIDSGLTDASGWCPVHPVTFESRFHPGIHVIGDAAQLSPMPKSGTSASTQAKIVASVIASAFTPGRALSVLPLESLCYSLIAPGYAVSVKGMYHQTGQGIVEDPASIALTSMDASGAQLADEESRALEWYRMITADIWG